MLARNDLAAYIADNYGECDRGSADCYHGNGCLKTGWRGVACPHWHPTPAATLEELERWQNSKR